MNCDLLIINGKILTNPDYGNLLDPGFIAVSDGLISKIGEMAELPKVLDADQILDASKGLVMPGLVNSHCHAAMSLFRGLADDLPLMTWLNEHIFPAEAKFVTAEMVYWCTKLAAAEMIMSGTTMVADGYFYEGEAARAFSEIGMRAVAAQGIIDYPAPGVPDPSLNVTVAAEYIDKWQNVDDLISPALFCHAPYTCSPVTLKSAKKLAMSKQVPFFIHVAETKAEVEQIKKEYGKSPVQHLNDIGVLDSNTICVHCVWLDQKDLDIIAATNTKIVTCPESNMKLAAGVAPVPEMLSRGITVGLGTDGCASNNDLDIFREMDTLAKLHKVTTLDPTIMPAAEVLNIATVGGSKALGFANNRALLKKGNPADIIIVDLDQPHFTPFYNHDLLAYTARGADVTDVIINGRLVMRNRELTMIDLAETKSRVIELAKEVKQFSR
jgi:5-methylthioadenosine/S-adenosylhomocysteine deaminase